MPAKKAKRIVGATDVKGTSTKQASSNAQKGGRRSKLRSLDDIVKMPTDVMHEITSYLYPRDILYLSWVSKDFHSFFMQKTSVYIWKRSLGYVPSLPPRPSKLIEPAWITFMLTTWCTGCGMTNTGTEPHWNFYVRFCKTCNGRHLTQYVHGDSRVAGDEWHICEDIPTDALNRVPRKSAYIPHAFLDSDIKEFMESWKQLLETNADEDTKALFLGKRIIEVRKIAKHAALCSGWVETLAQERKDEIEELRNERLFEVISRLRGLGWGPELDRLAKKGYVLLREQKQMRVAKKVTDRVWKNMEGDIVAYMQTVRGERLAEEREQRLYTRWTTFQPILMELRAHPSAVRYKMTCAEIALLPEVRAIIGASPDADVKVEPSSFDELREHFSEAVNHWYARLRDELCSIFFGSGAEPGSSKHSGASASHGSAVDPLELATTRFCCKSCSTYRGGTVWWPDVLDHPCMQVPLPSRSSKAKGDDDYEAFTDRMLARWYASYKVSHRRLIGKLTRSPPTALSHKLLEMCGKDPATVTAKEMDNLDVRFVLNDEVMNWRTAMDRQDRQDRQDAFRSWRLVTRGVTEGKECLQ